MIKPLLTLLLCVFIMFVAIRAIRAAAVFRARAFFAENAEQMKRYFYFNLLFAALLFVSLAVPFYIIGLTTLQIFVICGSFILALVMTF